MTSGKNTEEEEIGIFLPTDKITIWQYKNISMILWITFSKDWKQFIVLQYLLLLTNQTILS